MSKFTHFRLSSPTAVLSLVVALLSCYLNSAPASASMLRQPTPAHSAQSAEAPPRSGSSADPVALSGGRAEGYYWSPFDAPNDYGFNTEVISVNNSGEMIGIFENLQGFESFTFNSDLFRSVRSGASNATFLNGINDAGVAVGDFQYEHQGQYNFKSFIQAVNGTMTPLPPPAGSSAEVFALGISNDGYIAGELATTFYIGDGFIYHNGNYITKYDYPDTTGTALDGVNDVGQAVGYSYRQDGKEVAFLLDLKTGHATHLVYPGARATYVETINDAGMVVGFYTLGNGTRRDPYVDHGFLYDHGKYTTLDYPGAAGTMLIDVTDSGKLTGAYSDYYPDVSDITHGFVATPEPN